MPLEAIAQFPLLITIAVVVLLFVVGVSLASKFADKWNTEMEKESLEALLTDEIDQLVDKFGYEVHKKINYGMSPLGKVSKLYSQKNVVTEDFINEDGDKEEREVEKEYYYIKVRPASLPKMFMAKITDDVLNTNKYTDYIYCSEDHLDDNEEIVLQHGWNPDRMAGVWINEGEEESIEMIRQKTYKNLFEETLETSKEHARAIQNLNLQFVQNMLEIEKMKELKGGNLKEQMEEFMQGK